MKAYVFKINGEEIDVKSLNKWLNPIDWYHLFLMNKVQIDDCSSNNSHDMITVEEIRIDGGEKNE